MKTSSSSETLSITFSLECNCDFRSFTWNKTLMTRFSEYIQQKIGEPVVDFMSSLNAPILSMKPKVSLGRIVPSKYMSSKYTNCTWIPHQSNKSDGQTLTIVLSQEIFSCEEEKYTAATTSTVVLPISIYFGFGQIQYQDSVDCTWTIHEHTDFVSYDHIFVLDEFGSIKDVNLSDTDYLRITSSGKSYKSHRYDIRENGVLVCESDMIIKVMQTALGEILTPAILFLYIFSSYCLMWTIIHLLHHGEKIHLQLTLAIACVFLLSLVPPFLPDMPTGCAVLALIRNYGLLAEFVWMNIIAVNNWITSRTLRNFLHKNIYSILGWGIPLFLTIISAGMTYANVDKAYGSNFGGYRCWYTNKYAMLLYFGVPTAFSIILNIPIFVLTFINIHRIHQIPLSEAKSVPKQHYFTANIQFFILITITWIFEIISPFVNTSIPYFVFVVLTSLQGVFLLISFVCKKDVLSKFYKCCGSAVPGTNGKEKRTARS